MTWKTSVICFMTTIALVIGAEGIAAQSSTAIAASPATTTKPSATQWEYLVVSFGKAYFGDPMSSLDKQAGLSKIRAFSQAGVMDAQEATHFQYNMDKLGRFGWELVAAVGMIGGDQEFIFKRPFDQNRSLSESALIAEEGRRIEEMEKAMEAEQAGKAKQSADELIDLDEAERMAREAESRDTAEILLEQAVYEVASKPLIQDLKIVCKEEMWPPSGRVTVILDATAQLLKDGNKYRSSEARDFAAKFVQDFVKAAGLEPDLLFSNDRNLIMIETNIAITYAGMSRIVYTQYDRHYWIKK
jgi:hypothetical protein